MGDKARYARIVKELYINLQAFALTWLILLGLFIYSPWIRELVGGEVFYAENVALTHSAFYVFGISTALLFIRSYFSSSIHGP